MKQPYLAFYVGDWLKDPAVTLCLPATRGVWIDLLCVMHEQDRSGVITGTREQLARLSRCSTVELASALDDLKNTKTADVSERGGIVTLVNRRMKRERNKREQTRYRVSKHRGNTPVTPIEGDSESEIELPSGFPRTAEEATISAEFVGCGAAFATKTWNAGMGRSGRDAKGQPIRSFRHHLAAAWAYEQDRIGAGRVNGHAVTNGADTVKFNAEYERVLHRMTAIKATYGDHQTWSVGDRGEWQKLAARKKELKVILGITV